MQSNSFYLTQTILGRSAVLIQDQVMQAQSFGAGYTYFKHPISAPKLGQ
jgi:hypothetical protein